MLVLEGPWTLDLPKLAWLAETSVWRLAGWLQ